MILLYTFSALEQYQARRKRALEFLDLAVYSVSLRAVQCDNDTDYSDAIKSLWRSDDLLLMEQDIVPTLQQLSFAERLFKEHYLFAFPYYLYPASTRLELPVLSHRVVDDSRRGWRWGTLDDEYADFVGFGFSGISLAIQDSFPASWFDGKTWQTMDTEFSYEMQDRGLKWYIPRSIVEHDHI